MITSKIFSDSAVEDFLPLFERLPWPVIVISDAGTILYSHQSLYQADVNESQGGLFAEVYPEYYHALRGNPIWVHEQEAEICRQAHGVTLYERIYLRRYRDGAYLIVSDETRLHELEQERAQSARLASMGFMLAGICHEISNPLTAIHSLLQILQSHKQPTAEILDKGLSMIACNVKRILEISRRINNFSRIGDNQMTPMRIDWAIQESLMLVRQDPRFGQIEVSFQNDPNAYIKGNLCQLQQVFLNIFINAIQAMEGKGTLTIQTRYLPDLSQIEVIIQDMGPGIPAENLNKLFDPFFTTKPQGQGTGIGLAISKDIVTSHGGTISVTSPVGQGAIFNIRLPGKDQSQHE